VQLLDKFSLNNPTSYFSKTYDLLKCGCIGVPKATNVERCWSCVVHSIFCFIILFKNHLAYSMCPQDPKAQRLGHNINRCAFLAMHGFRV
jgi:hypothetical protein